MHKRLRLLALLCASATIPNLYAEDADINRNNEKVFSADQADDTQDTTTTPEQNSSDTLTGLERSLNSSGSAAWSELETYPRFSAIGFAALQNDTLDWTVKLGSATEKTSWDISSLQLGLGFEAELSEELQIYLHFRQSISHDGDADNSLSSPSNSYSGDSEEGSYQRICLGATYRYPINDQWSLGPHLGIFESTQEYQFANSMITGPSIDAASAELDSRFDTNWNGMLIGASATYLANEQWTLFFNLDLSLLDYEGEGRLNLRPDLKRKSFSQSGDGIGFDLSLSAHYQHSDRLAFYGLLIFSDWNVDGSEKRYPSGGGSVDSDLDEAHFSSLLIGGGARYVF